MQPHSPAVKVKKPDDYLTHCHSGAGSCSRSRNTRGKTCGSSWFGHGGSGAQLETAILIITIAVARRLARIGPLGFSSVSDKSDQNDSPRF